MARTIWFSNWNFRFSVVNGKYPKCPPYADSIFNYTNTTYTDKNKRRISDKCCQISTQFGDQLKLWRLFQGINDDLRSGYMKHSTLQANPALSVLDIGWNIASHIWHTIESVSSILTKQILPLNLQWLPTCTCTNNFFLSLGYFWTLVPFL